jgi:hypothetical protein
VGVCSCRAEDTGNLTGAPGRFEDSSLSGSLSLRGGCCGEEELDVRVRGVVRSLSGCNSAGDGDENRAGQDQEFPGGQFGISGAEVAAKDNER